jgi:FkbM family methyltransferase
MQFWRHPKFDWVELSLIVLFLSTVTWVITRATTPTPMRYSESTTREEAERLRRTYGPGHYSENEEEWIIRDFFKDRRHGFFVDVGANHYQLNSNTYLLETSLGWSGTAVDPQNGYAEDYRKYRPRTRFFPMFVSDVSNEEARVYMGGDAKLAVSADAAFAKMFGPLKESKAPTITLNDLLVNVHAEAIDLLSIDVELAEPKVLAGFDVGRYQPALVCIEAHPAVRQYILDYFARYHYTLLGRYLRVDIQNLYFSPLR